MHVKKENRHPFRGLRHKLEGSPSEVAKYERELADHLEQDKHENTLDKGLSGLSEKKPAHSKT